MATTKTNSALEGYRGPYLERSGRDSLVMAETLVKPPELPLSESEKQEVYDFEAFIYGHRVDSGLTIEEIDLTHKGETTTAPRFFSEAFLNGEVTLPELENGVPVFSSSGDVYKWLAICARDSIIDEDTMRGLAKQSSNYYKKTAAMFLVEDNEPSPSTLDNMSIVLNPTETVQMSNSVTQARQFLRSIRKNLNEDGSPLEGAKRAITDIYLGKINTLVVDDISTLDYLVKQSVLIGDDDTAKAATEVIPPAILNALGSRQQTTLRRLDYLRNGLGLDKNGHASSVDSGVIEHDYEEISESSTEQPLFTFEQREKLKAFKLTPQEMQGFYSRILEKAGLLSSENPSTWGPKRSTRASDGLFQVVINPTANNFAVDGFSGVYKVASEDRSLVDVIAVGGFHELEHVNQVQTDRVLGKKLKIAQLKGRRVGMLREGGANFKQRQAEMALFGECKPIALAYARALRVIEGGGSTFDASRAFYDEKLRALPDSDPAAIAKEAADRVLRLRLNGGVNSQPMAYAEELIMGKELRDAPPEVKDRAVAITSIDLTDQVRLHKYGLIDLPETTVVDWTDLVMKEAEPYILEALSMGA